MSGAGFRAEKWCPATPDLANFAPLPNAEGLVRCAPLFLQQPDAVPDRDRVAASIKELEYES